jgi:hypothetical protein
MGVSFQKTFSRHMTFEKRFFYLSLLSVLIIGLVSVFTVRGQTPVADAMGAGPILWEPVDIAGRDLYVGPGTLTPKLEGMEYLGKQPGGNNIKYRLKDGNGVEWVAKIADESRAEVAATRLMWAIGYHTEIDQIVERLNIEKVGNYRNARFEARSPEVKRGERWAWADNPFKGTKEFEGLKLMMALINNWDLKDENNVILNKDGRQYYIISDLGSSFGRLATTSDSRSGRSVGKAEHFADEVFIKGVEGDTLMLNYRGKADHLMQGIKVTDARWLADLLVQLSDKQISDAFRAANYSDEDVALYTATVKARIAALDAATRSAATTKNRP